MTNSAVSSIAPSEVDWVGTLEPQYYGQYFDYGMLLIFGGIPWQVSFRSDLFFFLTNKQKIKNFRHSSSLAGASHSNWNWNLKNGKSTWNDWWRVEIKCWCVHIQDHLDWSFYMCHIFLNWNRLTFNEFCRANRPAGRRSCLTWQLLVASSWPCRPS